MIDGLSAVLSATTWVDHLLWGIAIGLTYRLAQYLRVRLHRQGKGE